MLPVENKTKKLEKNLVFKKDFCIFVPRKKRYT